MLLAVRRGLFVSCYDEPMSWAGRRKGLYIGTSLIVLLALAGAVGYAWFSRPATCADGARNGNEQGVDCGGACARVCEGDALAPVVLWSRAFELAPGVYTAAAYIENRNGSMFARNVRYVFRLFDDRNVLIAERSGMATLAPTRFIPIIEANIATGNRAPARAFFELSSAPMWERGEAPDVEIVGQVFDENARRVALTVRNASLRDVEGMPVAAVLFDASGTAQAASVSVVPRLKKGAQEAVVFTWPSAFAAPIVEAQVIALPTP